MKANIHPDNYRLVAFKDMSNEDVFITKSTVNAKETIEVDGVEYPLVKFETSSSLMSHDPAAKLCLVVWMIRSSNTIGNLSGKSLASGDKSHKISNGSKHLRRPLPRAPVGGRYFPLLDLHTKSDATPDDARNQSVFPQKNFAREVA